MIEIDGSFGEGGGAILRMALGMAAYAGKAIRVKNIRAGRRKPGLAPQHLKAVEAVGAVCAARVRGTGLGSTELTFQPGPIRGGTLSFDIGTAGSTTLVLQALLLPCLRQAGPFEFRLTGGTDVPWSPPADYLRRVTLETLRPFGTGDLQVLRRGYYPKGGGKVQARLEGGAQPGIEPLNLTVPGEVAAIRGVSHAARVLQERHVAERQADAADHLLTRLGCPVDIEVVYSGAASSGCGITLWTESPNGPPLGASALGVRGKPGDEVGREAARALLEAMDTGAAVDRYLADQLIPFLAVAGGSLLTPEITNHTRSNIYVAECVLGTSFEIDGLMVRASP